MEIDYTPSSKKILLITSNNFPFGSASANLVRLLALGLSLNGFEIYVVIQGGKKNENNLNQSQKRKGYIDNVNFQFTGFLERPKNLFLKFLDNLLAIFVPAIIIIRRKLQKRIDCVIIYGDTFMFSFLIFLICKILKIPVIVHLVEWYEKETITVSKFGIFRWWDFIIGMKYLFPHFDGQLVSTTYLKEFFIRKTKNENTVYLLPNLVNLNDFANQSDFENGNSKILIGYCGSPTQKDGIEDLLSAFKIINGKFPNSHLIIIGDIIGNTQIPLLKMKANELNISNNISFTGFINYSTVSIELNKCQILVLARPKGIFAEAGFPTKLGEYLACKKSVVITNVGDISKYLRDGIEALIAEPNSPDSIADKILYLIQHPLEAKEIGINGYNWAKKELEYQIATKKLKSYIDKLIDFHLS